MRGLVVEVVLVGAVCLGMGCASDAEPYVPHRLAAEETEVRLVDQWSFGIRGRYVVGTEVRFELEATAECFAGDCAATIAEITADLELQSTSDALVLERIDEGTFLGRTVAEGRGWILAWSGGRVVASAEVEVLVPNQFSVHLGPRAVRLAGVGFDRDVEYLRDGTRCYGDSLLSFSAEGVDVVTSSATGDSLRIDGDVVGSGHLRFEALGLVREVEVETVATLDRIELDQVAGSTETEETIGVSYVVFASGFVGEVRVVAEPDYEWTVDGVELVGGATWVCTAHTSGVTTVEVSGGGRIARTELPIRCVDSFFFR